MDKNTITGLTLIFLVIVVFSYFNQPSKKEIAAKLHQDSIQVVEAQKAKNAEKTAAVLSGDSLAKAAKSSTARDTSTVALTREYGSFASAVNGQEKLITLENNLMKVVISNKGGRIYSVTLKKFQTYDKKPLVLFEGYNNRFGLNFFEDNKSIQTDNLFFTPDQNAESIVVTGPEVKIGKEGKEAYNKTNPGETKSLSMRLNAGNDQYIEYKYTLRHNSYLVGFDMITNGMDKLMGNNSKMMNFTWVTKIPRQEHKSSMGEDRYSTINYRFEGDKVEKLSESKSDAKSLRTKVQWIGFKQLFFSSVLIADQSPLVSAEIKTDKTDKDDKFLGQFSADMVMPFDGKNHEVLPMKFYFGPNHYNTLKQYGDGLEDEINLGWAIVAPVNKYLVIPVFNWLRTFISSFGIIILLLTIFIRIILTPFTYKSYMSQAKMRVLKPEIDEINKKYPADKPVERQQATMALYKKAGVNPLGGCLPVLLQFPILVALFYFFPTSIELRQQSFLWAHDLSTYDSIFNLPFSIPFYGDHVSLFCLLMTATTIISTKLTSGNQPGNDQMPG
ncbi:MAG: membrane protein insertase YidC, partial [Bacteroidota bacterium]|nr:membrane protein insertase YidC [Bacteroidota bacterium]